MDVAIFFPAGGERRGLKFSNEGGSEKEREKNGKERKRKDRMCVVWCGVV